jgi:hypothetical protein
LTDTTAFISVRTGVAAAGGAAGFGDEQLATSTAAYAIPATAATCTRPLNMLCTLHQAELEQRAVARYLMPTEIVKSICRGRPGSAVSPSAFQ